MIFVIHNREFSRFLIVDRLFSDETSNLHACTLELARLSNHECQAKSVRNKSKMVAKRRATQTQPTRIVNRELDCVTL